MSATLPLFGPEVGPMMPAAPAVETLARLTDPSSSHEAAVDQVESGRAVDHMFVVEQLLARDPWRTSVELYRRWEGELERHGVDRVELSRRLSSLLRAQPPRVVRMEPDANPTLAPCTASKRSESTGKRPVLVRWAVPKHAHLAYAWLADTGAQPIIDRGERAAKKEEAA